MAEYLYPGQQNNVVHDISYEQIRQLYNDNLQEKREGKSVTASSYRGENYFDGNNSRMAIFREELYRDPLTAGMRMYYPHGVVIEQAQRRNYYRGENKINPESVPSLHRKLNQYKSKKEKELYRLVADMRVAEFSALLNRFEHVRNWKQSDVLYEPLAQHYGLETGWLDITNDFNVALFFATCYWSNNEKRWLPLTKKQTESDEEKRQYGMIFHMPSYEMAMRWSMGLPKFMPPTGAEVERIEDGQGKYRLPGGLPYQGDIDNIIYPLGFQPFMRCSMQNGYGIYMRSPRPLQQDDGFEKLRFRHSERLSRDVYEAMKGGELIYPHEGLREAAYIIDQIKVATEFSEEAFRYALYRSHYYRLDDREQCLEDLLAFRVNGKPIEIVDHHPWNLSSGRRKRIDRAYKDFSVERCYGIKVLDRKPIPAPRGMIEPWMLPEEANEPGTADYSIRDAVDCGSIVERDAMRLLNTLMTAKVSDF